MKKIISTLIAVLVTLPILCACNSSKKDNTLNILTWDGYIPENVATNFQKETGIKINYSNFESNEEMLQKIQASKNGEYDLVIGSDYIIKIASDNNLLEELDKSKLPNYTNLDSTYLNQYYDPENKYTVPYSAGTPLIVYDPSKINVDIQGYGDLWNENLKEKVVLLDDARNIIGITLKSMGFSMNETDDQILNQAKQKLLDLKENIHHLDYNNPHESIISGETDIAYMFTPQVLLALEARPDLKVVYPKEGMGFGIDSWFIPKGAKNIENSYKFLNYIMDAKVGADISEQIMYLCPNKASYEYLSDTYKTNKALYIPKETLGQPEFIKDLGDNEQKYIDIWTEFKNSLSQ